MYWPEVQGVQGSLSVLVDLWPLWHPAGTTWILSLWWRYHRMITTRCLIWSLTCGPEAPGVPESPGAPGSPGGPCRNTHTQRHTHSLSRLSEWWLVYKAGLTSSRAPLLPSHRAILFFHPVPESKQTLNDSCVRQCDVRMTLIISHIKDVLVHSDRTAEVTTCCWHRAQMKNTQHYNHHQCQSIFVLLSADHRWDLQRQSYLLLKLTRC